MCCLFIIPPNVLSFLGPGRPPRCIDIPSFKGSGYGVKLCLFEVSAHNETQDDVHRCVDIPSLKGSGYGVKLCSFEVLAHNKTQDDAHRCVDTPSFKGSGYDFKFPRLSVFF